jgi:NAD(P)-dependent dehydrogenase (short-subunit alcohol dehydrogenase family)
MSTVALITGCSSGFGEVAALALARAGVAVAAGCRDTSKASALAATAKREGLSLELVTIDVRDERSVKACVDEVHAKLGPIDALVNNAGLHLIAPAELSRIEDAMAVLDTNVLGALRVMQAVLPEMRARRAGRIVNVTSGAAFVPVPHMAMYAASKHALDALSAAMANELLPFGVRVVIVAPGMFKTAIMDKGILPRETYDYSAMAARQCQSHIDGVYAAPDPAPVGAAIVRAVLDPDPPLRTLVGEAVEQALAPVAALHDGFQEWFAPEPSERYRP